jgi:rhomboid protease GluP
VTYTAHEKSPLKGGVDKQVAEDIINIINKEEELKQHLVEDIRNAVAVYQGQATLRVSCSFVFISGTRLCIFGDAVFLCTPMALLGFDEFEMIDTQDMGGPAPVIPACSKKQAMDWSLVLASQGIDAIINQAETGWELIVDLPEFERAKTVLGQYQIENRGWRWRRELPGTGVVFHWGASLWVLGIAAFYYWSAVRFPGLKDAGMVESRAVLKGQWWRLFTAVTLHENLPHLLSNATTGFLLLGLAMARFGPGIAMLAAFLAGVAGNYAGILIYPSDHASLGASGMVTGALGLITVQSFAPGRKTRVGAPFLPRAGAAGVLILVLIGFSPEADMVAHVGGFLAGAIFGLALGWVRPGTLQRNAANVACGLALGALVATTWLLASRG